MVEVGSAGAVGVEYSHFDVGEEWEAGFEQRDGKPDFASGRPVLVTAGSVMVVSRVQDHEAVVVLAVSDGAVVPAGEGWDFLGSVEYRPVYGGRMGVWGPTSGPAVSAADPVEVFGRRAVPGEPFLVLDPGVVYEVRVWARGRGTSAERFDAALDGDGDVPASGLEAYALLFVPAGRQEVPVRAAVQSRLRRLAAGDKPPLNMRS
ncbi:hypothetical protein ACWCQL_09585 [Streptomyces sp. NPDC002073]